MAGINLQIKFDDNITKFVDNMQKELNGLPDEAYAVFVKNTPVKTGNARRKTRQKNDTIEANYPYAGRLDDGYSKKSPKGMVEPTVEHIEKRIKQIAKGK